MIRAPKLLVSRPMYAFKPDTFRGKDYRFGGGRVLDAVWFRRKKGVLNAVMGAYSLSVGWGKPGDHLSAPPENTYDAWVALHSDNRYGGEHWSSWDGTALLTTDPPALAPDIVQERTEFLSTMLAGFPHPPAGFDGWWTFPREGR